MNKKRQLDASLLFLIIALSVGAFILLFPAILNFQEGEGKAAGLAIIVIALFATYRLPVYLTSLLFFLIAMLFRIVPARIAFSGFHSTALWLVFGGTVIGVAIQSSGLGKRIATILASRLDGGYAKLITIATLSGAAFSFIMPSAMGRIVLLVPISLVIADHFGFRKGSNGRVGLVLSLILGSYIPAFYILPANVPNIIVAGMSESQFDISFLYGEYFLLHFPILGIGKMLLTAITIILIYPDHPVSERVPTHNASEPMSKEEKNLASIMALLLILWLTDFVHHISPAWIALGGAILLMLPKINVVSDWLFNSRVNYSSIFFVAGIIGMGNMISFTGLGSTVGKALISILPLSPETSFINYVSISLTSTIMGLLTTLPGVPAVMTPLTPDIVDMTGFSIKSVIMLQVVGLSIMILPYQAPPVVVGLQLAREKYNKAIRPILIIALITLIIFIPINFLWWKLLGWI